MERIYRKREKKVKMITIYEEHLADLAKAVNAYWDDFDKQLLKALKKYSSKYQQRITD